MRNNTLRKLEGAAFDSFDPDTYDPDFLDGQPAQIGSETIKGGSFSLTLTNNALVPLTFELFNYTTSMTKARNAAYVTGAYDYRPFPSLVASATTETTESMVGCVGWDKDGNLVINGASGAGAGLVQCSEVPYKSLFEQVALRPMKCSKLRMTFTQSAQIDQKIIQFKKTWLGGNVENPVSPRRYFKPDQFQSLIVDVPTTDWKGFDSETGLRYIVGAGNVVKIDFFVDVFERTVF